MKNSVWQLLQLKLSLYNLEFIDENDGRKCWLQMQIDLSKNVTFGRNKWYIAKQLFSSVSVESGKYLRL